MGGRRDRRLVDQTLRVAQRLIERYERPEHHLRAPERGRSSFAVGAEELAARGQAVCSETGHHSGLGREYFQLFRDHVSSTESGASILFGAKP